MLCVLLPVINTINNVYGVFVNPSFEPILNQLPDIPVNRFTEENSDILGHVILFHALHWHHGANITGTMREHRLH